MGNHGKVCRRQTHSHTHTLIKIFEEHLNLVGSETSQSNDGKHNKDKPVHIMVSRARTHTHRHTLTRKKTQLVSDCLVDINILLCQGNGKKKNHFTAHSS